MKPLFTLLLFITIIFLSCQSKSGVTQKKTQPANNDLSEMAKAATGFLATLSASQKNETTFAFDDSEKYDWHYIPKTRNGLTLNEMNDKQREAAFALLHTALSDTGFNKTTAIMQLENVLKEMENRPASDNYRDPGNYHFSIFGNPAYDSIWGWRLEGHHISFNFSSENNQLVSGTPGFLGSNPAIVLSGPEKGKFILKDETDLGVAMLHSLNENQLAKAVINTRAPGDIVTSNSRKAMINNPRGILFSELDASQKKVFLQLLSIYIHRYTPVFAAEMMHEIEEAGLNNLRFAWAGDKESGVGHPIYYRIQGPTIIIEYDNTQNNANHIHTVIRDLTKDFGGDELLEHYKQSHHHH